MRYPRQHAELRPLPRLLRWLGSVWSCVGLATAQQQQEPPVPATPALRAVAPWSFQPVRALPPPTVVDHGWCSSDIDRFVFAALGAAGLQPSLQAQRRQLVRRVYLVAHGLLPTPAETEEFVTDVNANAYERLVDRVLASPRLGERWASFWLDLVHFAETTGFETNVPRPNAWPYRDYVIAAFNSDKPYPEFIREQLAGDAAGVDAATGFLVAGPYDEVKSPDPVLTAMQRHEEVRDIVNTTATAFLGLTVACATCHDHKFDPIAQRDFYAFKAIFAGVQHGERPLRALDLGRRQREVERLQQALAEVRSATDEFEPLATPRTAGPARRSAVLALRNVDRFAPVSARFVRFTVLATNNSEPCLDEVEIWSAGPDTRNVALASTGAKATASSLLPNYPKHQIAHLDDGRHGNEHSWISNEVGAGWAQIELARTEVIDRVVWGRDRAGEFRDRLATSYRIEVATTPGAFSVVADASDRSAPGGDPAVPADLPKARAESLLQLRVKADELKAQLAELAPRQVYAGTFTTPAAVHRLQRGDPMDAREAIAPGAVSAVLPPLIMEQSAPEQQRRLLLAQWLGSEQNPLTARVMVNRIWQLVFGEGLVRTPSDFGHMGAPPSHPELLDHLALRFMQQGWSIKRLQRDLLLTSTFRQASRPRAEGMQIDAGNRLLWRFAPRRLEAEAIHDAILEVSGTLDLTMGAAGYSSFEPNDNYVRVYDPKTRFTAADWRRMVYQTKVRMVPDPVFGVFDCPDAGQVAPRRQRSTTPLQALSLFNSGFVVEQAQRFAERLRREAGEAPAAQVERGFALAFGRQPTAQEMAAALRFLATQELPHFCRALFQANEFVFVD